MPVDLNYPRTDAVQFSASVSGLVLLLEQMTKQARGSFQIPAFKEPEMEFEPFTFTPSPDDPSQSLRLYTHLCQRCGLSFLSPLLNQDFCDDDCYLAFWTWKEQTDSNSTYLDARLFK